MFSEAADGDFQASKSTEYSASTKKQQDVGTKVHPFFWEGVLVAIHKQRLNHVFLCLHSWKMLHVQDNK